MNLLFIGSSRFGLRCLQTIQAIPGMHVCGVVSGPKIIRGVENRLYADLEIYSKRCSIPFHRMNKAMNEASLLNFVDSCNPDFGICVGWYHILPSVLLERFKVAALHASLLPDYSGGSPLVWAMIHGETRTGITFFLMNVHVDGGDIIGQKEVVIEEQDTIQTLYEKVELLGLELLQQYLPKIADGSVVYTKQDESKRRTFPPRRPEDGEINWSWDSKRIRNFIRAQTKPYPGAFTIQNGKKIIIWDADIIEQD